MDEAEHNAILMHFLRGIRDQQERGTPLRPEAAHTIVFLWHNVLLLREEAKATGGIITNERSAEIARKVGQAVARYHDDASAAEVLGPEPEQRAFEAIETLVNMGLVQVPDVEEGLLLVSEVGLENLARFEAITPELGLMLNDTAAAKEEERS